MTEEILTKDDINILLVLLREIPLSDVRVIDLREKLYRMKIDMYK